MRRVVVDTNIWISALINPAGPPAAIRAALALEQFQLVLSEPLLAELIAVAARPRIRRYPNVTVDSITALVVLLTERARMVTLRGDVALCRDPKDNIVLETALRGGATILVSRDNDMTRAPDLMAALQAARIDVMTVRRLLAALADP